MNKIENELVSIIDEMVGSAVSMNQGAQSYECFIQARSKSIEKIRELVTYNSVLSSAIKDLHKLI